MSLQPSARRPMDVLPMPGVVWGLYPLRHEKMPGLQAAWPSATGRIARGSRLGTVAADVRTQQAKWGALERSDREARLRELRALLARDGWRGPLRAEALGCVAETGHRVLGRDAYDCQLQAAGVLLDDKLAEMATGEGKTYAVALAAAVAALAGVPVHVMTANDYLVERDARQLGPFYSALGLTVAVVVASSAPPARRIAYAADITYCTAREVAFDHLRDTLQMTASGSELQRRSRLLTAGSTEAPALLLRGLCMAIVDEVDSLLIDEASMPLVLSEAADDPQQRAACFQALSLARGLRLDEDLSIDRETASMELTAAGEQRLEQASRELDGAWRNRRHRLDLVRAALEALHLLERDRHYVVRDGSVQLLDPLTGRTAPGRVWPRGLQTLVELKEGVVPTPPTTTRAQLSFQRFFARYLRLAGMSGTLTECRGEVKALYRRDIASVPLRKPCRRRLLRARLFADSAGRWRAVVRRVDWLHRRGRPVLVSTDSVDDSRALSRLLAAAGVVHRVLDARHDGDEAGIVAAAGQRGAVTVATQMAGRGTDIGLGPGVAAIGGLHVLCCQDNPSPRLDRQMVGRAARQGDPGSAEIWYALDRPRWRKVAPLLRRCGTRGEFNVVPLAGWLLDAVAKGLQRNDEGRRIRQRRRLLEQDREWQRMLGI